MQKARLIQRKFGASLWFNTQNNACIVYFSAWNSTMFSSLDSECSRWRWEGTKGNPAAAAAAAAKLLQSCPTLCSPIDSSPPGSAVLGILQARTLECVAISFSNAWKWKVKGKSLSRVRLCATPETAVHKAPPSLGFSRQEQWSGLPLPSPLCESEKCVQLFATPWTAAYQAPPSMGFSRQEYWSGLPLPSPQETLPISKGWQVLEYISSSPYLFSQF